jgi:hypothetical protein
MSTFDQITVKPNPNHREDVGFQIDPTNAPYVNVGGEMTGSVMGVHDIALGEIGEIGVYGEGPAGVIGSGSAFTTGAGQAAGVCGCRLYELGPSGPAVVTATPPSPRL